MNLAEFFALITGLKTACTHAGLDPKTANVEIYSRDGRVMAIVAEGTGKHGPVTLRFGGKGIDSAPNGTTL